MHVLAHSNIVYYYVYESSYEISGTFKVKAPI